MPESSQRGAVPCHGLRDRYGAEVEGGAYAVLDERAGQVPRDRVGGFPAGAVGGDDHVGCELLQRANGVADDRLEQGAGEMEPADDRVQLVHAGQALGVAADVDHAGVPAAGEDDEPAPGDVGDQCLVVQDQRVGLPAAAAPGLVDGEPLLEAGDAVDLAGDQHRPVIQERRLPLLDDVKARFVQGAAAGGGQLERLTAGDGQAPPGPELGVDQHRQVRPAQPGDEPGQPGGVVEVAVAAHDRLDAGGIAAQAAQVVGAAVRGHAGVEQQPPHLAALAHLDQGGEPVLGERGVRHLASGQRRGIQHRCLRLIPASDSRFAGPSSGSSMSMALSHTVSTFSSSTGSSGSTSPFHSALAGNASTGLPSAWLPASHIDCSSLTAARPGFVPRPDRNSSPTSV